MAPPAPRGRPTRSAVYRRLAESVEALGRLGGLPSPDAAAAIWGDVWFRDTHHSTAIEGNTLALAQVQMLLAEGRTSGARALAEYLDVRGYADAAAWVYRQGVASGDWSGGELVTLTAVRHVHALALGPVWTAAPHPEATPDERPGNWRRHDIRPFPGGMQPPDWPEVPALMRDWVTAACGLDSSPSLPERLADLHAWFERIHPFLDGNGRAGRLITSLLLVRLGYPPAVIRRAERTRYLIALRAADRGDAGPLGELLARAVTDTLLRFVVPAVTGPTALVPLAALATEGTSVRALRTAAERGRLLARRDGRGQWLSSRAWVDEYRGNRYRRNQL